MKYVTFEDAQGRKFVVLLPDNAPDSHASRGVRLGPPDLRPLGLPARMEIALNNQLFSRGLIERSDYMRKPEEVRNALLAVFRVDVQTIQALFDRADDDD